MVGSPTIRAPDNPATSSSNLIGSRFYEADRVPSDGGLGSSRWHGVVPEGTYGLQRRAPDPPQPFVPIPEGFRDTAKRIQRFHRKPERQRTHRRFPPAVHRR